MITEYRFRVVEVWCSNGCDCCEPTLITSYEDVDNIIPYGFSDVESLVVHILEREGLIDSEDCDSTISIDICIDILHDNNIEIYIGDKTIHDYHCV